MQTKGKEKPAKVKKPRKVKLKSVAVLVEETAKILQRLVRAKAADEFGMAKCITCSKREHWKKLQGGHFISRVHLATKIMEENIHPQCMHCNVFRAKDSLVMANYVDYMYDTYGREFVTELRQMAVQPKKYTREEIMAIKEDFERQLTELEPKLPPMLAELIFIDEEPCQDEYPDYY